MTKIVNLTPHAITLFKGEETITIEPSGIVARVSTRTVRVGDVDGIAITSTEFGEVENLPDSENGTIYIVASLVAQRVPERTDVFIPNESVRDDKGRIVGCKSLGRI